MRHPPPERCSWRASPASIPSPLPCWHRCPAACSSFCAAAQTNRSSWLRCCRMFPSAAGGCSFSRLLRWPPALAYPPSNLIGVESNRVKFTFMKFFTYSDALPMRHLNIAFGSEVLAQCLSADQRYCFNFHGNGQHVWQCVAAMQELGLSLLHPGMGPREASAHMSKPQVMPTAQQNSRNVRPPSAHSTGPASLPLKQHHHSAYPYSEGAHQYMLIKRFLRQAAYCKVAMRIWECRWRFFSLI